MFCVKCGTNNDDGAAFCLNCGAPLTASSEIVQEQGQQSMQGQQPEQQPVQAQQPVPQMMQQTAAYAGGNGSEPQKSGKKWVFGVGIGALLVALAAGGAYGVKCLLDDDDSKTDDEDSEDDEKYEKCIAKAEEYLEDEEYESALEQYEKAYKYKGKYSKADKKNLYEIYKHMLLEYAEEDNSKKVMKAYKELQKYGDPDDEVMEVVERYEDGSGASDDRNGSAAVTEQAPSAAVEPEESIGEPIEEPEYGRWGAPLTDAYGNVYDLGGMEVTLYTWFDEEAVTDAYGEAREEWREWIQETYNFTFTIDSSHGWGGTSEDFSNYVSTGGDANNYIFCMANRPDLTAFMNNGLMYDLATLDCLDFSDRKYTQNALHDYFTKGTGIYAMYAGVPEPRAGVFFNKGLLEQTTGMTADDIYDLQKNNEWTWSKFEEILKKIQAGGDVDGDGVTDIYGIAGNTGSWVTNIVFSNGGRWFDKENGNLVCTAYDSRTVDGFLFAKRIMESEYWYQQPEGREWDYFFDAFNKEGKFVFLPEDAYNMTGNNRFSKAADTPPEDDYGFVMTPRSDSATSYTNRYSDNVYAIPACYDQDTAWKIAFAYDQFFAQIPGYEDYNPRLSRYYAGASDSRAVDETIVRMCSEGGCVDYTSLVPGVDIGPDLQWFDPYQDVYDLLGATITKWEDAVRDANR